MSDGIEWIQDAWQRGGPDFYVTCARGLIPQALVERMSDHEPVQMLPEAASWTRRYRRMRRCWSSTRSRTTPCPVPLPPQRTGRHQLLAVGRRTTRQRGGRPRRSDGTSRGGRRRAAGPGARSAACDREPLRSQPAEDGHRGRHTARPRHAHFGLTQLVSAVSRSFDQMVTMTSAAPSVSSVPVAPRPVKASRPAPPADAGVLVVAAAWLRSHWPVRLGSDGRRRWAEVPEPRRSHPGGGRQHRLCLHRLLLEPDDRRRILGPRSAVPLIHQ